MQETKPGNAGVIIKTVWFVISATVFPNGNTISAAAAGGRRPLLVNKRFGDLCEAL